MPQQIAVPATSSLPDVRDAVVASHEMLDADVHPLHTDDQQVAKEGLASLRLCVLLGSCQRPADCHLQVQAIALHEQVVHAECADPAPGCTAGVQAIHDAVDTPTKVPWPVGRVRIQHVPPWLSGHLLAGDHRQHILHGGGQVLLQQVLRATVEDAAFVSHASLPRASNASACRHNGCGGGGACQGRRAKQSRAAKKMPLRLRTPPCARERRTPSTHALTHIPSISLSLSLSLPLSLSVSFSCTPSLVCVMFHAKSR